MFERRVGFELARHLVAVDIGQLHIAHDQTVARALRKRQTLAPGGCAVGCVAKCGKQIRHQLKVCCIIFNHQHVRHANPPEKPA